MLNDYKNIFNRCFNNEIIELNRKINDNKLMQDNLLDLRLRNKINEDIFTDKNSRLKKELLNYNSNLKQIKNKKFDYSLYQNELNKISDVTLNYKMYIDIFLSEIIVSKIDNRRCK